MNTYACAFSMRLCLGVERLHLGPRHLSQGDFAGTEATALGTGGGFTCGGRTLKQQQEKLSLFQSSNLELPQKR